jgi:imidazolonepropionase-like amidohydrolase
MNRIATRSILFLLLLFCTFAQSQQPPAAHNDVVIRNAVVMTVTHGIVQNGSVYIKDGKIAAVGNDVSVPSSATNRDLVMNYLTHALRGNLLVQIHCYRADGSDRSLRR